MHRHHLPTPRLLRAVTFGLLAAALVVPPTAHAAGPGADLTPTITAPSVTRVGDVARYTVNVTNRGNKASGAIVLTVQLPVTHTSPNVSVLGVLGAVDGACGLSGTRLVCNLSSLRGGASRAVFFDIALPYSTAPITFTATTSTTNDTRPANNSATRTATQSFYTVTVPGPSSDVQNSHCTGTGLTSYFDCISAPSSISSHPATFVPTTSSSGTIDFSLLGPDGVGYAGTWTTSGTRLTFEYTFDGTVVGTFDGRGSAANCWDGPMTFPGSTYMAMYRVCL